MNDLMKLKEVAALLRVTPQTVYKLIQEGKLTAIKVGTQWRFDTKQIEEWLEKQQVHKQEGARHG